MTKQRIPSTIKRSERSGYFVATVYGPAPYGGSISQAFPTDTHARWWVARREERYSESRSFG